MRTVWDIIKSPVVTEKALVAKEETQDTRSVADLPRRSTRDQAGDQDGGRDDLSGEGRPRAHDQLHGQDGATRPLRRPQAFLEEGVRNTEARREAG